MSLSHSSSITVRASSHYTLGSAAVVGYRFCQRLPSRRSTRCAVAFLASTMALFAFANEARKPSFQPANRDHWMLEDRWESSSGATGERQDLDEVFTVTHCKGYLRIYLKETDRKKKEREKDRQTDRQTRKKE